MNLLRIIGERIKTKTKTGEANKGILEKKEKEMNSERMRVRNGTITKGTAQDLRTTITDLIDNNILNYHRKTCNVTKALTRDKSRQREVEDTRRRNRTNLRK